MQKFNKTQIALAISASMLAGSALAAAPVLLASATQATLAVAGTATAANMLNKAGTTGTVTIKVLLSEATTDVGFLVNTGTNDDVLVKFGTTLFAVGNIAATNAAAIEGGGATSIQITIQTVAANDRIRIDQATSKLQFSTDAGVTFVDVTTEVVKAATNPLNDVATSTALASATLGVKSVYASETLIVAPTAKTFAVADASLISGVTVDFKHAIEAPTNTLVLLSGNGAGNTTAAAISGSAVASMTVPTFTLVTGSVASYDVKLPDATKVDWDASGTIDAADAALYVSKDFNTGVRTAAGTLPLDVTVAATGPKYASIFDSSAGTAIIEVAAGAIAATDGAAPVLTKAEVVGTGLDLTFSEPIALIIGGNHPEDVREVLENVSLGTSTLAADYLNRYEYAAVSVANTADNVGVMTISRITDNRAIGDDVAGKTVTVKTGLSLSESDEVVAVPGTPTLDGEGVKSASNAIEGPTGSKMASINNEVDADTGVARAYYGADLTKVHTIELDLKKPLTKKVGANFDNKFIVTFRSWNDLEGFWDNYFEWFPTDAQITLSGTKVIFTVPTDLLQNNLQGKNNPQPSTVGFLAVDPATNGRYNNAKPTGELLATVDALPVSVLPGDTEIILPLSAIAQTSTLYTMDVKATLTGAADGSTVVGYLAKWVDKPLANAAAAAISNGKFTIPGDKWATDVVLDLTNGTVNGGAGTLKAAIETQLASTKPVAVPAWIVVTRSNDTVKGGANTGSQADFSENYLVATGKLYGTAAAAAAAVDTQDRSTAFEVSVDPKTGKFTGRLTGSLTLTNGAGNASNRGLVFIGSDGVLYNNAGAAAQSQALVKDGKARMLIGADPIKDLKGAGDLFKDAFVLMVLNQQDDTGTTVSSLVTSAEPSMTNFLPFAANLVTGNDKVGEVTVDVPKMQQWSLTGGSNWQLVGAGNLSRKTGAAAAINMPRLLVGLSGGSPYSFWTNDGAVKDMALTLLGNKPGVAVESKDADTNSVADKSNTKANAFAFALADENGDSGDLYFADVAAVDPALPVGWALIAVPSGVTSTSDLPSGGADGEVSMVLNVGDQLGTQQSWVTGDPAIALEERQPVFIYVKKALKGL